MIDIIHHIVAGENDVGGQIPQRDMEDRAPSRAFAKFAEVWRERGGGDRDKRGVTQHGLDICGSLYPDLVESPLTLVLELLRASFIFVKKDEGFHLREHGQEESSDLEID